MGSETGEGVQTFGLVSHAASPLMRGAGQMPALRRIAYGAGYLAADPKKVTDIARASPEDESVRTPVKPHHHIGVLAHAPTPVPVGLIR